MQRNDTDQGTTGDPLAGILAAREARRALLATGLYHQCRDQRLVERDLVPLGLKLAATGVALVALFCSCIALIAGAHWAVSLGLFLLTLAAVAPVLPTSQLNPFHRVAWRRAERLLKPTAIWQGFVRGEVTLPLARSCVRRVETLQGRSVSIRRAGTTEPVDSWDVRALRLDRSVAASHRFIEVTFREGALDGVISARDLDGLALSATLSTLIAADRTPVKVDDAEVAAARAALGQRPS